jgi:hypothetical protein
MHPDKIPLTTVPPRLVVFSKPTANATAPVEALRRAGTLDAKRFVFTNTDGESCSVEGGHVLNPLFQGKNPGWLQAMLTKMYIRWYWGRSQLFRDSLRIEGDAPTYAGYTRIGPEEIIALAKMGPDGTPPIIQPGDIIFNGSAGTTGHVVNYVGNNEKGEPQIVHAMATQFEGRSFVQRLWDVAKLTTGWKPDKIGVIQEGLGTFFTRFYRDTVIVLRDPRMTSAMREKFISRIKELVGKAYDFSFNSRNEQYFCSEVTMEGFIKAYEGSGLPMPWIGVSWIESGIWPVRIAQWIPRPEDLALSPDFKFIWANESGRKTFENIHRTMVCGKKV